MFLTPAEAALVRERFGTPCYVYDRAALEAAARAALAFPHAFGFTLRYAMKANSNRAVLRLFRDLGLHVDEEAQDGAVRVRGRGAGRRGSSSPRWARSATRRSCSHPR